MIHTWPTAERWSQNGTQPEGGSGLRIRSHLLVFPALTGCFRSYARGGVSYYKYWFYLTW